MPAHTPGPWFASAHIVHTLNGTRLAQAYADAQLMAAAPELLAALELFVRESWFCVECSDTGATNGKPASQNTMDCPACEGGRRHMLEIERNRIARAAIAKARGGTA